MKKMLMLTTGGTIASVPSAEGLVPASSAEITRFLGQIAGDFELTVCEIMAMDSTNIQPEEWKIIAREIYAGFTGYSGIVVTHGTDTMAYTASMMSFMIKKPPIPVVFTGSQLPISDPLTDGVMNLRTAFAMAQSGRPGIFVAFDRKILLGCRAVKVRTTAFDAFESVNLPPVAEINAKGLVIHDHILPHTSGEPGLDTELDTGVFLLKLTPGSNPDIFSLLIENGCRGIVIEAFGAGGVQFIRRDFIHGLELAHERGVPVVVCSQCLYESSDFSIYQVGKKALEKGAIQGLDMTTESAVTKLMWILGHTRSLTEIRDFFSQSVAGEIFAPIG